MLFNYVYHFVNTNLILLHFELLDYPCDRHITLYDVNSKMGLEQDCCAKKKGY